DQLGAGAASQANLSPLHDLLENRSLGRQDFVRPAHHQAVPAYAPDPVRRVAPVLVHRGAGRLLPRGHAVLLGSVGRHERADDDHGLAARGPPDRQLHDLPHARRAVPRPRPGQRRRHGRMGGGRVLAAGPHRGIRFNDPHCPAERGQESGSESDRPQL
ncbi:MAG: hypothetical protein AVDCRST_MAG23-1317, partial [uncultured Sphingosinicella sp.]